MTDVQVLNDLLTRPRASSQEIAFFSSPRAPFDTSTVADLRERALLRLGAMRAAGVLEGDEVVMPIGDPSLFLDTFWACLFGGFVAMPLAPPVNAASARKIIDILGSRKSAHLVASTGELERLTAADSDISSRALRLTEGVPAEPANRAPDDIAFVQYSSGSTRAPKGVIVRHAQALANIESIAAGAEVVPHDRTLSWMPLSHDMGLVGFHLTPLYRGEFQAIMPTSAFARSPLLWLTFATQLSATILSSPNFGYRHVLKAIERKGVPEGVDLSAVRLIMNGAEPISVDLCSEFSAKLRDHGLRSNAILPVYGLAEATLAVTFPTLGSEVAGLRLDRDQLGPGESVRETNADGALVACGCGAPLAGVEVRIAGDDGGPLEDDRVGRVWIRGDNVTEGYYDDVAATADAVQGEGWLDTGDLGFMRGGQLFITGRAKDLVIADGQNFYPHDLEDSLQRALDIDAMRLAVAPLQRSGGSEEAAVFVQHRGEPGSFLDIAAAVRGHLSETFGLGVDLVVPVERIPRTTSGKVQRLQLSRALLAGEFDDVLGTLGAQIQPASGATESNDPAATDASPEALEAMMIEFCDQVLDGVRFGPTDNLFEQGMSSIDLAEIHGLIESRYPKGLDIRDFFDQPTIRGLAQILAERVRSGAHAAGV